MGPVAAALPHVLGRHYTVPSAMGDPRHRATRRRIVTWGTPMDPEESLA